MRITVFVPMLLCCWALTLARPSLPGVQESSPKAEAKPAEEIATESSSPQEERFVKAVERAVKAFAAKDQEAFESLFGAKVNGRQPNELWRGAFVIASKFGKVKRISFSEHDAPGAFVSVAFERAEREFYVQLGEQGKLSELSYVPPPVH